MINNNNNTIKIDVNKGLTSNNVTHVSKDGVNPRLDAKNSVNNGNGHIIEPINHGGGNQDVITIPAADVDCDDQTEWAKDHIPSNDQSGRVFTQVTEKPGGMYPVFSMPMGQPSHLSVYYSGTAPEVANFLSGLKQRLPVDGDAHQIFEYIKLVRDGVTQNRFGKRIEQPDVDLSRMVNAVDIEVLPTINSPSDFYSKIKLATLGDNWFWDQVLPVDTENTEGLSQPDALFHVSQIPDSITMSQKAQALAHVMKHVEMVEHHYQAAVEGMSNKDEWNTFQVTVVYLLKLMDQVNNAMSVDTGSIPIGGLGFEVDNPGDNARLLLRNYVEKIQLKAFEFILTNKRCLYLLPEQKTQWFQLLDHSLAFVRRCEGHHLTVMRHKAYLGDAFTNIVGGKEYIHVDIYFWTNLQALRYFFDARIMDNSQIPNEEKMSQSKDKVAVLLSQINDAILDTVQVLKELLEEDEYELGPYKFEQWTSFYNSLDFF